MEAGTVGEPRHVKKEIGSGNAFGTDHNWGDAGIALSGLVTWRPTEKQQVRQEPHHLTVRHCRVSNNGAQAIGGIAA